MHDPVLLSEMINNLQPSDKEIYLDCTFGYGGYTKEILNSANCKLYAYDQDPHVIPFANEIYNKFPDDFVFRNENFTSIIDDYSLTEKIDGLVLDLGVSSMQIDQAKRGFSFNLEGKLDMRMNQKQKLTAFEVINNFSEKRLRDIIWEFGEEKKAFFVSKAIVDYRKKKEITTTTELAEIIRGAIKAKRKKIDLSTKTFQAIRIFVNNEISNLRKILELSKRILKKGGRLIVVSFHSLEDRIVKNFLREESGYNDRNVSRYDLAFKIKNTNDFVLPKLSAIKPSTEEIERNPRSRSARMRIAIKT